jgi:hypothetical protein
LLNPKHDDAGNGNFSSGGLWSVLRWLDHWVQRHEQRLERSVLGSRLTGATLMITAIAFGIGTGADLTGMSFRGRENQPLFFVVESGSRVGTCGL